MIIDTRSKEGIASSLASYLNIIEGELYQYIDYAANKAQPDRWGFNIDVFQEELLSIFSDLQPEESINEMYVYHLTRRLNSAADDVSGNNLKGLLLTQSTLSNFLQKHAVTFIERDGHPVLYHHGKEVDLNDTNETDVCYLRSRLGYNAGREDYCFNGFALRDLLMKNSYTRELYDCPEFISVISRHLTDANIKKEYFSNSKYYCFTYKLKMDEVLFDDRDSLVGEDKVDYLLVQLCMRLLAYTDTKPQYIYDHDNPVIRVADDACISAENMVVQEEITIEMIK